MLNETLDWWALLLLNDGSDKKKKIPTKQTKYDLCFN